MDTHSSALLYLLILGCEVAFWLALFGGLAIRYILRRQRLSAVVLWCVPLIDVALLVFTVIDLRSGTTATFAHGLATAYVGFTVAFAALMIRWADERFAHRFDGGPQPKRPPSQGWASVLHELKLWMRCLAAVAITYALLTMMIAVVDEPSRTKALEVWYRLPLTTAFFWFVFGPLWQLVFFKRAG